MAKRNSLILSTESSSAKSCPIIELIQHRRNKTSHAAAMTSETPHRKIQKYYHQRFQVTKNRQRSAKKRNKCNGLCVCMYIHMQAYMQISDNSCRFKSLLRLPQNTLSCLLCLFLAGTVRLIRLFIMKKAQPTSERFNIKLYKTSSAGISDALNEQSGLHNTSI